MLGVGGGLDGAFFVAEDLRPPFLLSALESTLGTNAGGGGWMANGTSGTPTLACACAQMPPVAVKKPKEIEKKIKRRVCVCASESE